MVLKSETLETMKKGFMPQRPDSVTWGTLLVHYEKKDELEKMQEMLKELLKDNGKLVAHPFSHMIRACIFIGMVEED